MKKNSLSVSYITSRPEPQFSWFLESLAHQCAEELDVIIIDTMGGYQPKQFGPLRIKVYKPKPTVWSGPHRLTRVDWWSKANAINTAICYCNTEWISFVDDRSVLMDTWLAAVQAAIEGRYAVCGPYQKRHSMTVEDGFIKHAGIITGEDNRLQYVKDNWMDPRHKLSNPYACPGAWWYGCSTALPMEWALAINGADETCDSSSGEDYIMGRMLENSGYPIKFDTRMMMVEDRSPDKLGPPLIRRDKGVSPNDKSHALLDRLGNQKRAQHQWDIAQIRSGVRQGLPFPVPMSPTHDWYDGQLLSEMEAG